MDNLLALVLDEIKLVRSELAAHIHDEKQDFRNIRTELSGLKDMLHRRELEHKELEGRVKTLSAKVALIVSGAITALGAAIKHFFLQ